MVEEHNTVVPLNGNGLTSEGEGNVKQSECIVARLYQEDLLQRALNRNIIISLGTGTGKTYVAVMLLKEMAGPTMIPISEGGKRSVFLVDKVPLVKQQAEQIRMHSTLNVGEFYGAMGVDLWDKSVWEQKLEEYQVLVMTAQILRNLLVHGYASIHLFNVMVIDECHHATKNHPYRQIMSRYKETQGVLMCNNRSWNEGPAIWVIWSAGNSNGRLFVSGLSSRQLSQLQSKSDEFFVPSIKLRSTQLLMRFDGFRVEYDTSTVWVCTQEHNLACFEVNVLMVTRTVGDSWAARLCNVERRIFNVERYCSAASHGYIASCKHCDTVFARGGTSGELSVLPAPNLNAVQTSENAFSLPTETEPPGDGQHSCSRCFLSFSHFFMDLEAHDYSRAVVEGQRIFKCPNCHSGLGLFLARSLSPLFGVQGAICSFFHGSATLSIRDNHGEQQSFDSFTFPSPEHREEHLYAWTIRKEFEQRERQTLLFQSFGGRDQILITLLDPVAILACGLLDEDGVCAPMAAIKLSFVCDDVDVIALSFLMRAPAVYLPESDIGFLKLLLQNNRKHLPGSTLTQDGKFQIAFLRLAQL